MLNNGQKTGLRVFSVLAAALWVVLGVANGWSAWVWIPLAAVSLVMPSLVGLALAELALRRSTTSAPQREFAAEPPPRPMPPQPQAFPVHDVLLRSAREDYQFVFSCTVRWLPCMNAPAPPHTQPGALAANTILDEATKLAATVRPEDASRAQYQVMSALGNPRVDLTGRVQAWADQISLRLAEKDANRLKRLAEVRKDEEVWEYERSYERNVRTYLGDEVLATPGNALVWWLAGPRTDEKQRVNEAVNQIENLRQLARAATAADPGDRMIFTGFEHDGSAFNGPGSADGLPRLPYAATQPPAAEDGHDTDPPLGRHAIGLLEGFPDTPERALLARQIADCLRSAGHDELADTICDRFDAPAWTPESASPAETATATAEGVIMVDAAAPIADEYGEPDDTETTPQPTHPQRTSNADDPDAGSAEPGYDS